MARKRKPVEEEESSYNWMDTYGDLVTNLLCFFVLLYAMSHLDEAKWNDLVEAFSQDPTAAAAPVFDISFAREEAISNIDPMVNYENRGKENEDNPSTDAGNIELTEIQDEIDEIFDKLYQLILEFIMENGLQENMSVERTEELIIIRFGEVFLFNSGEATLIDNGSTLLEKITKLVSNNIDAIAGLTIEGHTDNIPINTARFQSNWELSTARAASVLQEILEFGIIEPKIMTASGCGEYWPVDTNETPEGRARNRRVDIIIEKIDAKSYNRS